MGGRGASVKAKMNSRKQRISYKGSISAAKMPGRKTQLYGSEYSKLTIEPGRANFRAKTTSLRANRSNATLNGMRLPRDRNVKGAILFFGKNDLASYARSTGAHLPTLQRWRDRAVRIKNSREPNLNQYKKNQLKDLKTKLSSYESRFGASDNTVKTLKSRLVKAQSSKTGHWDSVTDLKTYNQLKKNGGKLNRWE